ncbi:helix-turn-helix domain-containing protein [Mycobacterium sp. SMC-18]|uniref:helix-turn-helix domain-containing protein n=1 Tax=Mycobacterium sp. SMC-18 TaxID=3381629 RepID=UPI00387685C7
MAGRPPDTGETAEAVKNNIKRLREAQNLTWTQLSARLDALDWTLTAVAIKNIEAGNRRVNVDDLAFLAAALGVSPVTLLMPWVAADEIVTAAGAEFKAATLWEWLIAEWPFPGQGLTEFFSKALPPWKLETVERRIYARGRALSQRAIHGDDPDAQRLLASRMTPEMSEKLRTVLELGDEDAAEMNRLLAEVIKELGVADGND